jgi:hypothetical protein
MDKVGRSLSPLAAQVVATVALCGVCFYAGGKLSSVTPNGKYLVADKEAVVLSAVLDRDSTDARTLQAEITQPILAVMQRYTEQGYVIIDGGHDERGNMTIAALPEGTRDITKELAAAIPKKSAAK